MTIDPSGTSLRSYGPSGRADGADVGSDSSVFVRSARNSASVSGAGAEAGGAAGADSRRAAGAVETERVAFTGAPYPAA